MELIIAINLDNDAMGDNIEINRVIQKTGNHIESVLSATENNDGSFSVLPNQSGSIRDTNGNSVGSWRVQD